MQMFQVTENRTANISYPSSSAAVVFGGHLSARAAFRPAVLESEIDQLIYHLYDLTAKEIEIIEN